MLQEEEKMNSKDFMELFEDTISECRDILTSKGQDYSDYEDDRLSNFKDVANLIPIQCPHCNKVYKLSPKIVWAIYFLKHVFAIMKWVGGAKLKSEGFSGRICDGTNYLSLGHGLYIEEENQIHD